MNCRFFLLLLSGVALVINGCTQQQPLSPNLSDTEQTSSAKVPPQLFNDDDDASARVKVMTRNIYAGTAIDVVAFQNADKDQLVALVNNAIVLLQSTSFPQRAPALAQEIAEALPALVGLQEVALISLPPQSPEQPSVELNYLNILLPILNGLLANTGFQYNVVGIVNNAMLEFPGIVELSGVSLLNRDVVLARSDVAIEKVLTDNYNLLDATLIFKILGIDFPFLRGFVAVNATIGKQTFRFVNTHLENANTAIRLKQAQELANMLRNETLPVILVGDFNSSAPNGQTYQFLTGVTGFIDVWDKKINPFNPNGFTASQDPTLLNVGSKLSSRIDFIFVRTEDDDVEEIDPVFAFVVGDELDDKILVARPDGSFDLLWPSDHAGVIASFRLPESDDDDDDDDDDDEDDDRS